MIVAWCCATLVIGMLIAQILLRGIALIRRCMGLPPLGQGDVVEVEGTPRNIPRHPGQRLIGTIVACPYEETNHCKRAEVDEDRLCCICLSEMEPDEEAKELICNHAFHADCIDKWLMVSVLCPLCKQRAAPKPGDVDRETRLDNEA